ncbi:MAG TPA: IclR family transcriptional regulator [Methylomirabilota bacterium]|nr:IclR family transcriptional regulator [Methylomirabilota bacterium]
MPRSPYTLHTLAKGLKALETLEAADAGLTLTEVAHRLRESQTVVFRLLKTLAEHGYVQQDAATKRYTLGLRLWEMGARVAGRTGLAEAARPALKWLTSVTGQTSALVVLRDTDVLYVDVVEGVESLRFYADLGARAPAYATASGKAILAYHADLVPGVVERGLRRLTPGTVTQAADLRRRLADIRRTGLSINRGERRDDIAAVAAPLFNARAECVAAISIAGPRTRFNDDTLEEFAKHVSKASEGISLKLGYREHL